MDEPHCMKCVQLSNELKMAKEYISLLLEMRKTWEASNARLEEDLKKSRDMISYLEKHIHDSAMKLLQLQSKE